MTNNESIDQKPNIGAIFLAFLKLGCTSFGGPIAHIGYFRTEFVEKRRWLNDETFSQLLAISQFLPGPASSQLGFSIGLLKGQWLGAMAAFIAFTLPSVLLLLLFVGSLSYFDTSTGQAAIHGLKLVACAVVADAVLSMYGKLCSDSTRKYLALFSCVALLLFTSSLVQLFVISVSAMVGYFFISGLPQSSHLLQVKYGSKTGFRLLTVFALLLLLLPILASREPTLVSIAYTFYQAGALVFGGGHVVLPLLDASIVESTQWLTEAEFLAGYGASQAIPGPMFAFSSYLGALIPGDGIPLVQAFVATVFMFSPGFLLIAGILPYWQQISSKPSTFGAIAGINAAVVGILGAALYDPIFTTSIENGGDLSVVLVSLALLRVTKVSPLLIVVWCVATSAIFQQ